MTIKQTSQTLPRTPHTKQFGRQDMEIPEWPPRWVYIKELQGLSITLATFFPNAYRFQLE